MLSVHENDGGWLKLTISLFSVVENEKVNCKSVGISQWATINNAIFQSMKMYQPASERLLLPLSSRLTGSV